MNTPISIGIPALNEEANIGLLLNSLLAQKSEHTELKEIIVISDGSTDRTADIVESIAKQDSRVILVNHTNRAGASMRQNEILEMFSGEILVLLNADVIPESDTFLDVICEPIIADTTVGLVGARVKPLPAQGFIEGIINWSARFKRDFYESLEEMHRIYLCHGRARAFSRTFAKSFTWKPLVGEDAFSYIQCIKLGYRFVYQKNACVKYRSPQTITDHIKQSGRFIQGQSVLSSFESDDENRKELHASFLVTLGSLIRRQPLTFMRLVGKHLILNPIFAVSYIGLFGVSYVATALFPSYFGKSRWDVSDSSKVLGTQLGLIFLDHVAI